VVIDNSKDPARAHQKWGLPRDYFLFVGRLIPEKSLPALLAAYGKYVSAIGPESDPWNLIICGSGPEEEKLKEGIQNLPEHAQKKIMLHGYIKQPEIIDFFSFASCFVLPSVSESWGLVINEAMACGLPAIVSNRCGCAKDLVIENETGWSIDPDNVDDLANRMLQITRMDKTRRAAMGLRAKEEIAKWGLDRFSRGALESACIALNHQKLKGN
jgi:glycosyltransferase involved in cell wall biosynthesis